MVEKRHFNNHHQKLSVKDAIWIRMIAMVYNNKNALRNWVED